MYRCAAADVLQDVCRVTPSHVSTLLVVRCVSMCVVCVRVRFMPECTVCVCVCTYVVPPSVMVGDKGSPLSGAVAALTPPPMGGKVLSVGNRV